MDKYPELRAIRELVIATAEARDEASLARKEAAEANERAQLAEAKAESATVAANLALETAQHMTIEAFVIGNHLVRQFPPQQWSALGKRLTAYCFAHNIQVFDVPVVGEHYDTEKSYPMHALGWLIRHPTAKQGDLVPVRR